MSGIERLAKTILADMERRLSGQRKTQRSKLSLLVATMLEVRSANLMDLAACLPRPAERLDTRYQWIKRLLANARVVSDAVMAPYGREVLARLSARGQRIVLLIDQTQASERHQAVMVAVRLGGRALPLAWRVKPTHGAIGFAEQREALQAVARLLPAGAQPVLIGDRFYGSPDLIAWCGERGWGSGGESAEEEAALIDDNAPQQRRRRRGEGTKAAAIEAHDVQAVRHPRRAVRFGEQRRRRTEFAEAREGAGVAAPDAIGATAHDRGFLAEVHVDLAVAVQLGLVPESAIA